MFYENYLNSLKPDTSYIPESVSISDMAIFANRAYQDAYNEAFFALASQEMAVFEATILEADEGANDSASNTAAKKNVLEIVKKAVSTIWTKIKGFFSRISTNVQKKFNDFKKKRSAKVKGDFEKGLNKLSSDYTAKGVYKFDALKVNDFDGVSQKVADFALKGYDNLALTDLDSWKSDYNKDAIAKILGYDSAEGISIEMPEKVEVSVSDIKTNKNLIEDVVFEGKALIKKISKAYKEAKKSIDGVLRSAKKVANSTKKDDNAEFNGKIKAMIAFCKECTSMITSTVGKSVNVALSIRSNWVGLVNKIAIKGMGKEKTAVGEDTQITIEVQDDNADDANVSVNGDEVEESFNALMESDDEEEEDIKATKAENEKSCKESVLDDKTIEESALYRALCAFLD